MSREDLVQEIVENIARCQRPPHFTNWPKTGLSHAQLGMLFMLSYHKRLQIKQIAEYLGISKSAASQTVSPLVDKGLVERRANPQDRRIIYLSLAAKGVKYFKKIHKHKFAGLRSRLDGLSATELNQFARLCRKLATRAQNAK